MANSDSNRSYLAARSDDGYHAWSAALNDAREIFDILEQAMSMLPPESDEVRCLLKDAADRADSIGDEADRLALKAYKPGYC